MQVQQVTGNSPKRTIGAFLLSVFISSIVLSALLPLGIELTLKSLLASWLVYIPYSMLVHLVFGLPAYALLRKYTAFKFWQVVMAGAVCGGFSCAILILSSVANLTWLWRMVLAAVISSAVSYALLRPPSHNSFAKLEP